MTNNNGRGPEVVAPPPVIFVIFLGAGLLLDWLWPLPVFHPAFWAGVVPALVLAVASGGLALAGYVCFGRHGTPVDPAKPAKNIISSGPFRLSRNPMYLALALLFAAVFCLRPSWWLAGFGAGFFAAMVFGVIIPEKKYLLEKFGREYKDYMAKTRRWL